MNAVHQSRERAAAAAEKLRVYAQPQRLMILSLLLTGERTVGNIDAATGIGQPALSQQLAQLRRAAIVATRRATKLIYYRLANDAVTDCVRSIENMFGDGSAPAAQSARITPAHAPTPDATRRRGSANFAQIV